MTESAFKLRWGILGAGHISGVFVKDVILDPKTSVHFPVPIAELFYSNTCRRGVNDVTHEFVAVGSRDAQKAREWIASTTGRDDHPAKAYGSYQEVVDDPVSGHNLCHSLPLTLHLRTECRRGIYR